MPFLLYHGNNALDITTLEIPSDELSGLRILHLSDLHNKSFGKNQEKIIEKKKKLNLVKIKGVVLDIFLIANFQKIFSINEDNK